MKCMSSAPRGRAQPPLRPSSAAPFAVLFLPAIVLAQFPQPSLAQPSPSGPAALARLTDPQAWNQIDTDEAFLSLLPQILFFLHEVRSGGQPPQVALNRAFDSHGLAGVRRELTLEQILAAYSTADRSGCFSWQPNLELLRSGQPPLLRDAEGRAMELAPRFLVEPSAYPLGAREIANVTLSLRWKGQPNPALAPGISEAFQKRLEGLHTPASLPLILPIAEVPPPTVEPPDMTTFRAARREDRPDAAVFRVDVDIGAPVDLSYYGGPQIDVTIRGSDAGNIRYTLSDPTQRRPVVSYDRTGTPYTKWITVGEDLTMRKEGGESVGSGLSKRYLLYSQPQWIRVYFLDTLATGNNQRALMIEVSASD